MLSQNILYIEASRAEYKEMLEEKKPRSWLKSVSAFANTHGGHLIFGVKNEPRIAVGLPDPQHVVSKVTELIKARIDPTPRFQINSVKIEDKNCIDLVVQDGPAYPYYYTCDGSRVAYVRHGDQSLEATAYEQNELILKGINKTYDALPSAYEMGDVSFTLLAATFKTRKHEDFDLEKDLRSSELVTPDGQVTNGGLLLCDQGVLRQSRIFCTRWKGNCKGNVDKDALDDKEFQGASLITLLQSAEDFIRNNSKNPWSIRGMRREEHSDYPYRAVREVLVNALIHRDYQILGSEIHVDIFDDRLEIFSPGGMMNGRRIQDMDLHHIPSMRRNQVISDVFARLDLMDRRGSGIDRILNSYAEVASKPEFYSDSDTFLVTLPNRSVAEPAQISMIKPVITREGSEAEKQSVATSGQSVASVATDAQNVETSFREEQEDFEHLVDGLPCNRVTKKHIKELFRRYGYEYPFRSGNVADIFGVKTAGASAILRKLIFKYGLVESPQYAVYRFIKR